MTVVSRTSRRGPRAEVAASWQRALAAGVVPEDSSDPVIQSGAQFEQIRSRHPLAPHVAELLGVLAGDGWADDHLVVISDASGVILWLAGSPVLRGPLDRIGITEGAHWDEFDVGTNAIGTALHDERATIINGPEHLVFAHQPWLCAADVVRDPTTGRVLACIDLTSPARDGRSIALAAARAGARLAELLLERRSSTPGLLPTPAADVRLLGPGQPTAFGVPLTTRRADIVALLVEHPEGLNGDEIAYRLFGDDGKAATVRAEIHRIRRQLPGLIVGQPYRLADDVSTDVGLVRNLAANGDAAAVAAYPDDLLPRSEALEIEMIRSELRQSVRAVAMGRGGQALESWCNSRSGRGDLAAIERRLGELGALDAAREQLEARRCRLLRRYA